MTTIEKIIEEIDANMKEAREIIDAEIDGHTPCYQALDAVAHALESLVRLIKANGAKT